MPKRTDISSILIIGAGPIVIGQACEFDYSGAQAVKALKSEGYRVILVNSNPATIMTDPELADATYIEPITPEVVTKIIEKEKPDALLPTMGGQTALNTGLALHEDGTLAKYGVELIGAKAESIEKAEDRELFRNAMDKIGLESPKSILTTNMDEARAAAKEIGLGLSKPILSMAAVLLTTSLSSKTSLPPAWTYRRTLRFWSKNLSWAGKNTRWKLSAIKPTTASSFVRLKISTLWAFTPAIR